MNYTISTQDLADLLGVSRQALAGYPDAKESYGRHDLKKFIRALLADHAKEVSDLKAAARQRELDLRTREKNLADKESHFQELEQLHLATVKALESTIKELRAEVAQQKWNTHLDWQRVKELEALVADERRNTDLLAERLHKLADKQQKEPLQGLVNQPLDDTVGAKPEFGLVAQRETPTVVSIPEPNQNQDTQRVASPLSSQEPGQLSLASGSVPIEQSDFHFRRLLAQHLENIAAKKSWTNSWE